MLLVGIRLLGIRLRATAKGSGKERGQARALAHLPVLLANWVKIGAKSGYAPFIQVEAIRELCYDEAQELYRRCIKKPEEEEHYPCKRYPVPIQAV